MDRSPRTQAATLDDFEAWMRAQSYDDLAAIGVEGSIEEPLRLLSAFRRSLDLN